MALPKPQTATPLIGEDSSMLNELDRILSLRLLSPWFMPIVDTQARKILGYEALIRGPEESPLHSPANLFPLAHKSGRLLELELLCRELAIARFRQLNLPGKLFLNVTPQSLQEPDFRTGATRQMMHHYGINSEQLVLEITEQFPIGDYSVMRETVSHYREQGFQVALDDLGAGYSGLRSWSELRPQFVKIDRHFVDGVDKSPIKQEFVRSILEVSRSIGCQVIAEGIEQQAEHHCLNELGVQLQQGFYFAPPRPLPATELPMSLLSNAVAIHSSVSVNLAEICQPRPTLTPAHTIGEAARRFRKHPHLLAIAVQEKGVPIGLLHRDACLNLYLSPFGRELHERKPIRPYLDLKPLVLEEQQSLEALAERIESLDASLVRTDFIITRNGGYLGMGAVIDLLKRVTGLQLRHARYANPLTQLPGAVPIHEAINERLQRAEPLVVAYLDIDHFKAFNDHYGFQRGDQMIQLLANLLRQFCDQNRDFIGHIGGDDFIVLFASSDWHNRLLELQASFLKRAENLYDSEDLARGELPVRNRDGTARSSPLATLSIGVACPDPGRCESHHQVAALASDAKKLAKQQHGNALVVNRRRGP